MNIHTPDLDRTPSREDAAEALERLRQWAARASEAEIADLDPSLARLLPGREPAAYPVLSRAYPYGFEVDTDYTDSLPDLQYGPSRLIRGARQQIQHVGISNF
ncbi:MAG: GTP cyclohydrolase I FolE2, partial [Paracoccaceae bacterium]|nr:GTP cyclohydrolase I FolE2 [Paracoccaceae bacterium]